VERSDLRQVVARLALLQREAEHRKVRRALYTYGEFCVDLRMEARQNSINACLVGQIYNRRSLSGLSDIPVALTAGKRTLQQTTCNALGEFVTHYIHNPRLRLRFDLANERLSIEISLKDLAAARPDGRTVMGW
jgi:hypothetical protein